MRIIIGLGNPGGKYELTRHNAGFMAVDALAAKYGSAWEKNKKFNAAVCRINGDTILVKPLTFMNESGRAVESLLSYYKLLPRKFGVLKAKDADLSSILTVIHDDIDIELGKYKISSDSRSAGHRGVESVINHLKTKNFKRIRIGIRSSAPSLMPTEKFVLQRFSEEELKMVREIITRINAGEIK